MLYLYRRHKPTCRVHGLKLSAEAVKFYTECDCPIWMTGKTDQKEYPRQATGLRDWKAAEALLRSHQAESLDAALHGPTLSDCIRRYLDSRTDLKGKALSHYQLVLGRLQHFCQSRNRSFIRQLDLDMLEDFVTYHIKIYKATTAGTHIAKLKCFLKEAARRSWIDKPIHTLMKTVASTHETKQPFTDEEITLILNEAEKMNGGVSGYATKPKTFKLLLRLMLETGLRVSDAVRFNPAKCQKGDYLWIYSFVPTKSRKDKTAKQTEVFLTESLKQSIDDADWFSSSLPFAYRSLNFDADVNYQTQAVYERMQSIGSKAGVEDCRPHRLRDTFAVRLLVKGIALDDVSKLLGHSSVSITEKYYAPWVASRKKRLERLLSESLVHPESN